MEQTVINNTASAEIKAQTLANSKSMLAEIKNRLVQPLADSSYRALLKSKNELEADIQAMELELYGPQKPNLSTVTFQDLEVELEQKRRALGCRMALTPEEVRRIEGEVAAIEEELTYRRDKLSR